MSRFGDMALDARKRRANRSNRFTPNVNGWSYRQYNYWYDETDRERPASRQIGRCTYDIIVARALLMKGRRKIYHALGNTVVRLVLAALVVAAVAVSAALVHSVFTGLVYVLGGVVVTAYVTSGVAYGAVTAGRIIDGEWPVEIPGTDDSDVILTIFATVLGLVFLPFVILGAACFALVGAMTGIAKLTRSTVEDVLTGLLVLVAGAWFTLILVWAFMSSWIVTLSVIGCVLMAIGIGFGVSSLARTYVDRLEDKRNEETKRTERATLQAYLDSPEMDEALRLIFARVHPEKVDRAGAFEQWRPRYLRHYTLSYADRHWMPFMWHLDDDTLTNVTSTLTAAEISSEQPKPADTPSKLDNVVDFLTFVWELAKNAHSHACALMELPEEEPETAQNVNLEKE